MMKKNHFSSHKWVIHILVMGLNLSLTLGLLLLESCLDFHNPIIPIQQRDQDRSAKTSTKEPVRQAENSKDTQEEQAGSFLALTDKPTSSPEHLSVDKSKTTKIQESISTKDQVQQSFINRQPNYSSIPTPNSTVVNKEMQSANATKKQQKLKVISKEKALRAKQHQANKQHKEKEKYNYDKKEEQNRGEKDLEERLQDKVFNLPQDYEVRFYKKHEKWKANVKHFSKPLRVVLQPGMSLVQLLKLPEGIYPNYIQIIKPDGNMNREGYVLVSQYYGYGLSGGGKEDKNKRKFSDKGETESEKASQGEKKKSKLDNQGTTTTNNSHSAPSSEERSSPSDMPNSEYERMLIKDPDYVPSEGSEEQYKNRKRKRKKEKKGKKTKYLKTNPSNVEEEASSASNESLYGAEAVIAAVTEIERPEIIAAKIADQKLKEAEKAAEVAKNAVERAKEVKTAAEAEKLTELAEKAAEIGEEAATQAAKVVEEVNRRKEAAKGMEEEVEELEKAAEELLRQVKTTKEAAARAKASAIAAKRIAGRKRLVEKAEEEVAAAEKKLAAVEHEEIADEVVTAIAAAVNEAVSLIEIADRRIADAGIEEEQEEEEQTTEKVMVAAEKILKIAVTTVEKAIKISLEEAKIAEKTTKSAENISAVTEALAAEKVAGAIVKSIIRILKAGESIQKVVAEKATRLAKQVEIIDQVAGLIKQTKEVKEQVEEKTKKVKEITEILVAIQEEKRAAEEKARREAAKKAKRKARLKKDEANDKNYVPNSEEESSSSRELESLLKKYKLVRAKQKKKDAAKEKELFEKCKEAIAKAYLKAYEIPVEAIKRYTKAVLEHNEESEEAALILQKFQVAYPEEFNLVKESDLLKKEIEKLKEQATKEDDIEAKKMLTELRKSGLYSVLDQSTIDAYKKAIVKAINPEAANTEEVVNEFTAKAARRLIYITKENEGTNNLSPMRISDLIVMKVKALETSEIIEWGGDYDSPEDANAANIFGPLFTAGDGKKYEDVVMTIDPSKKGEDEVAYCVAKRSGDYYFIIAVGGMAGSYDLDRRGNKKKVRKKLISIALEHQVNTVYVENNIDFSLPMLLQQHWNERQGTVSNNNLEFIGYHEDKEKEGKIITTLQPLLHEHRLIIDKEALEADFSSEPQSDLNYKFFYQLMAVGEIAAPNKKLRQYFNGRKPEHDDRVDVVANAIYFLRNKKEMIEKFKEEVSFLKESIKSNSETESDSELENRLNALRQLGEKFKNGIEGVNSYKKSKKSHKYYKKYIETAKAHNLIPDAEAQFNLAQLYQEIGEDTEAKTLYREAAKQGHPEALYKLACGIHTENQRKGTLYEEADMIYYYYKKAADNGSTAAQYYLAVLYENNVFSNVSGALKLEKDRIILAMNLYKKAAEGGNAWAQQELGEKYCQGVYVKQDFKKAFKWFLLAAKQGEAEAQSQAAILYYRGQGVTQSFKKAFKWNLRAAEQNNLTAQINLANMYRRGRGVDATDYAQASRWYEKAIGQKSIWALYELGRMYQKLCQETEDSEQLKEYFNKAVGYYKQAYEFKIDQEQNVEEGLELEEHESLRVSSSFQLGKIYEKFGRKIGQEKAAQDWYVKAAQQGHVKARQKIVLLYLAGKLNEAYLDVLGLNKKERKSTIKEWLTNVADKDSDKQKVSPLKKFIQGKDTSSTVGATTKKLGETDPRNKGKEKENSPQLKNDDAQIMNNYEYTPTDISRLIRLKLLQEFTKEEIEYFTLSGKQAPLIDDEEEGELNYYKLKNRYILPPIYHDRAAGKGPYEALVEWSTTWLGANNIAKNDTPDEFIIPFNPGAHWVTLRIIASKKEVKIEYIDSLYHDEEDINKAKEDDIKEKIKGFQEVLKKHFNRNEVKLVIRAARLQPDSKACGVLVIENIYDLARDRQPKTSKLTKQDIYKLRLAQRDLLKKSGFDLDFDKT